MSKDATREIAMSFWDRLYLKIHTYWALRGYMNGGRACDGYDGPILGVHIDYDQAKITVYGPPPGACPTLIKKLTSPSVPELTAGTRAERN